MGSKLQPGNFDCYTNALPDEPMFILLARDECAPAIVEKWAEYRRGLITIGEKPASDELMIAEALQCAEAMRAWREKNDGKWRNSASPPVSDASREAWRPIKTAPKDGNFHFYGLHVTNPRMTWFEAYYLARNEEGEMIQTCGDPFSEWSFDDFEVWSPGLVLNNSFDKTGGGK